ncbi:MAG: DNA cytosine methyltransferase [Sutterellaceae bacterium]|nr:DNA cytosine methyltransferase [Sutterellaceae bacterium]MDD7442637.1 DNA cytosine methyltransferase [Sutterellaceae bacterium]MDY2868327.1 DNA cytosine methyltransferase [Mesosutterella sp.]
MTKKRNHIELFAGCGGLSLGLESCGFGLAMANELSPMAGESFAYNLLHEDLENPELGTSTFWLHSRYPRSEMAKRLRENPFEYPKLSEKGYSDMPGDPESLEGSLVLGDIWSLNEWLGKHPDAAEALRTGFGKGGVDLVSGGPPCQSFSMAGLREKNSSKNKLPWAFAEFVGIVRPKITLLENVTGILRPFTDGGKKYYAWFEVCKAFAEKGYVPLPLHVNARFAGVAQNRPRFILIGMREDFYKKAEQNFNPTEKKLYEAPWMFYQALRNGKPADISDLPIRDLNKGEYDWFEDSFLAPLLRKKSDFVSVKDAINDLKLENPSRPSSFVREINKTFAGVLGKPRRKPLPNDDKVANTPRVARRFRIYQVFSKLGNADRRVAAAILRGTQEDLPDSIWEKLKGNKFLLESGEMGTFGKKEDLVAYLKAHETKKIVQKALLADDPAPAALSIPDDCCHYEEIRTLSVREMARIQSFPDSFVFRSKVTTGGHSRRFEVPQFTQVGNAVPALLGRALGLVIEKLLEKGEGDSN